jgi:hypothetical protein
MTTLKFELGSWSSEYGLGMALVAGGRDGLVSTMTSRVEDNGYTTSCLPILTIVCVSFTDTFPHGSIVCILYLHRRLAKLAKARGIMPKKTKERASRLERAGKGQIKAGTLPVVGIVAPGELTPYPIIINRLELVECY